MTGQAIQIALQASDEYDRGGQIVSVDEKFSVFQYLIHVCVGCLTYCIYIIVTSLRKRNWIVQVSDLTLDQTHLVL